MWRDTSQSAGTLTILLLSRAAVCRCAAPRVLPEGDLALAAAAAAQLLGAGGQALAVGRRSLGQEHKYFWKVNKRRQVWLA